MMLPLGTTGQAALRVRRQHVPQGKHSSVPVTELKFTDAYVEYGRQDFFNIAAFSDTCYDSNDLSSTMILAT